MDHRTLFLETCSLGTFALSPGFAVMFPQMKRLPDISSCFYTPSILCSWTWSLAWGQVVSLIYQVWERRKLSQLFASYFQELQFQGHIPTLGLQWSLWSTPGVHEPLNCMHNLIDLFLPFMRTMTFITCLKRSLISKNQSNQLGLF